MDLQVTPFRVTTNMTKAEIIRFQLVVYCHLKKVHLTTDQMACATLLGVMGKVKLLDFTKAIVNNGIYQSNQSARNAIIALFSAGLLEKEKVVKGCGKLITLNHGLQIATTGNILVEIKCLSLDAKTS